MVEFLKDKHSDKIMAHLAQYVDVKSPVWLISFTPHTQLPLVSTTCSFPS